MPNRTWEEYERAQSNRRIDRMPKRRDEVLALKGKGYDVRELAFGHFRIDGKLDLYLLHRRFHFLPTNERGGYIKAAQIAPEWLRRRGHQRKPKGEVMDTRDSAVEEQTEPTTGTVSSLTPPEPQTVTSAHGDGDPSPTAAADQEHDAGGE